jgi:hypothetical protein
MATRDGRRQLYQALKAHKFDLENTRGVTSGFDQEILDRRIEAARLLLEWISQALEPQPAASQVIQQAPPSGSAADEHQTPPSAPNPQKPPR